MGIGIGLILVGFALLFWNQASLDSSPVTTRAANVAPEAKARLMQHMLLWLVVLVLVFMVSTTAFLRWSRHFRRSILRKPHCPTPDEDVWAMHKLPEGALEEWTDPGSADEADRPDEPPDR
jgi:hypothetical protein